MPKTEIAWNLSEIFPSTTDPSVQKAIDKISRVAKEFAKKYQGRIANLTPDQLAECLKKYEEYRADLGDITLFSELSFAANMTLPDTQSLLDKVMKTDANLGKMLAFFELEVGTLVSKNLQIASEPVLAGYRHSLDRFKRAAVHQLSEIEEQLIIEKDQYGVKAWQELQMKWLNTRTFEVEVEGKKKKISFGEAGGLFSHPDRATRESAYKSIYGLLNEQGEVFNFALRNTCNDWLNVCQRRKYDSPMDASLIDNDIDRKPIDSLLQTVETQADLYRRFLKLKAKLMNLPRLGCHDLLAPLPDQHTATVTYEKAREQVVKAYSKFDEEYASAVKDMFAKNHLDSSPRFGKQNGAFCASWYNGKSAFILNSFNGRLRDVYTLAHELGHATHDYYAQRKQSILNLRTPMIVAETASIFGELLLTDLLLGEAKSELEKKTILTSVLDNASRPIFSVTARAWFELSLYDTLKKGGYLDLETTCEKWVAARNRIYGDSVEWFKEMRAEWTTTPHYFMANFRFYNYPYLYAQLFVYALYQKYQEQGRKFVPKFKQMLTAGSSISPKEIGKIADLDINDPDFWKQGTKQYEHFLKQLEQITT